MRLGPEVEHLLRWDIASLEVRRSELSEPEDIAVLETPRDRLARSPQAGAISIQPQLAGEAVEAMQDMLLAVAELCGANDRAQRELSFSNERLGIDHQPRFPASAQHIVTVEILVEQHLVALGGGQLLEDTDRTVEE